MWHHLLENEDPGIAPNQASTKRDAKSQFKDVIYERRPTGRK